MMPMRRYPSKVVKAADEKVTVHFKGWASR
eukprot:SAG25_NODE_8311_length_428_cov_1.264438_1_plen_29_part_10